MARKATISLAEYPRRSKFGAVPVTIDGIRFDSKGEAGYWFALKAMERTGEIFDLRRQVPVDLTVNGHVIARMRLDYAWLDKTGTPHVADFKGAPPTPDWRLKAKLYRALFGREIEIVGPAA